MKLALNLIEKMKLKENKNLIDAKYEMTEASPQAKPHKLSLLIISLTLLTVNTFE